MIDPQPDRNREFSSRLLDWYASVARDLPWRRTRDPYAIWISETMLQQTQVATVVSYWTRWMELFPTVGDLAAAPLHDVLHAWQGLGYYARARNLHRAAQTVAAEQGGVFPTRFEDVLALPGVGRYTAGAVCSIAYDQDVPIVDANVVRVLCRVFEVRGDPKRPATQERLWALADDLLPRGKAADYNQALMELGALVCHRAPRCPDCPVRDLCYAARTGNPTSLPEFAPRPQFTTQTDVCAVLRDEQKRILIVRRPPEGLWGGLWELPRVTQAEGETGEEAARRAAREIAGWDAKPGVRLAAIKHGVTTRRITLLAYECAPIGPHEPMTTVSAAERVWAAPEDLGAYPLSSPQRRLAAHLLAPRDQPSLFDGVS